MCARVRRYITDVPFEVIADLVWAEDIFVESSSNVLTYDVTIDGNVEGTGVIDLNDSRSLPSSINCGAATLASSGTHTVGVTVKVDDFQSGNEREYQSFAAGASFVPLIIILLFASTTHMVCRSDIGAAFYIRCHELTMTYAY
jgi:hypothetical protein